LNVCIDLKEEITSGSIQLRVALMGEDQASFGQPTGPHPRLLKEVASGLIKRIAETYRGHLDWRSTDHRERLVVTLIFSPPHENSGTTFA
jgi:hypothetical protein